MEFHRCLMENKYFGARYITANFYEHAREAEIMESELSGVTCEWLGFVGEAMEIEDEE